MGLNTTVLRALAARWQERGLRILAGEPMSRHTTLRIGGPADLFVPIAGGEVLAAAVADCRTAGVPFMLMGRGSNLLAADAGIRGVVFAAGGEKPVRSGEEKNTLLLDAGTTLARAANAAAERGLSGLEFAHGIPGTVGGGIFMNAGAYGGELRDVITWVEVLTPEGAVHRLTCAECAFGYRESRFAHSKEIILRAEVALSPDDPKEILARQRDYAARRRQSQPLDYPSAGSTFRRPPEGMPPAALLIDRCGLKGLRVGGAAVSEKHAGFLINCGGATAEDFFRLMTQVRDTVFEREGIRLQPEVRFAGDWPAELIWEE